MSRQKFTWTSKQFDKLNKIQEILEELKDYKPLTLRQVYYQLVGKGYIENNTSQYTMLSKLLKWSRIDGYISWEDIEDRVRAFHDLRGWYCKDDFVNQEMKYFLTGYRRDLLQSQDVYLEVWIEKDALSSIFIRTCSPYTIPVVVCRGFSSVSFLNNFRVRLSYYSDKIPIMLYFGDFDPSGVEMLNAMKVTLENELGLDNIEFKRVSLLKDDISTYRLPHNPNAIKVKDSRSKKHLEKYGELAVELDALKPDVLEQKIIDAIEDELCMNAFNDEIQKRDIELDLLNKFKDKVAKKITERI